ncbi:MAG: helix-turn-helix domain-containing protein [Paenibacillaceae bacterium]|nr:helix-turn-helix domain-containing protein [Paenibacillaceae bacterium]
MEERLQQRVDDAFNRSLTEFPVYCKTKQDTDNMQFMHAHDGYEFHFSYSSGGTCLVEEQEYAFHPGKVTIIRPHTFHFIRPARVDAYKRVILSVEEAYLAALIRQEPELAALFGGWFRADGAGAEDDRQPAALMQLAFRSREDAAAMEFILQQIEKELGLRKANYELMVKSALIGLLVALGRQNDEAEAVPSLPETHREAMEQAAAHITAYCGENLSVAELARRFHLSVSYFNKLFKLHSGCTPHQFQTLQRINAAKELLGEGTLPITEISLRLGYGELATFSRTFRSVAGVSPSAYRSGQRP